jgi:hypothetical protein
MPRHPFFLVLCAASSLYLLWANTRGYTPFYSNNPVSRSQSAGAHRFFHK